MKRNDVFMWPDVSRGLFPVQLRERAQGHAGSENENLKKFLFCFFLFFFHSTFPEDSGMLRLVAVAAVAS